MLQALLNGKMSREQENMEDILTSNVFGLLNYLPPDVGLLPFLAHSESIDRQRRFPLHFLANRNETAGATVESPQFWPSWDENGCAPCEPDVVIRIKLPVRGSFVILIEAKYRSGKSTEALESEERPYDQLAREWDNLVHVAQRENAQPFLIYLSTHFGVPRAEIEASIAEFRQKRPFASQPNILALSWRQLPEVFRLREELILKDICELAKRLGLLYFHGLHLAETRARSAWRFSPLPARRFRIVGNQRVQWRFNR